ncbi:family 2 glycosyl hydrolase [Stachybotrys elegans]|uniref:Beta-mannosidase B n=1 Tax=Stachybotrys elegans TaxID=80388 RepID=A0A8K0SST7_9HYPO|nr:family 2 glycosyl hydrolase [Stachybotrys elegans]
MHRCRHDLSKGWRLRQCDQPQDWLPARRLPTQVHLDLLENKRIPNPFLDLNELAVRWVGEKSWVYQLRFKRPMTDHENGASTSDLILKGLDTFARVVLNGVEILKADNMFLAHRIDVTGHLRDDNELEIIFDSTVLRGRQLLEQHSHEHTFYVRQTEASRVPVRSAQYNWGWDWGPITLTMGPWKPIYIEQFVSRIDDIWVQYELSEDFTTVSGTIFVLTRGKYTSTVDVIMCLDGNTCFEVECPTNPDGLAQAQFTVESPQLWNPAGYGKQTLYTVKAAILSLDSIEKKIGFRRAELVQKADDLGRSFFFRINGVDIFCGGSCWIPADSFLSQMTTSRYYDWMKLMIEGRQNMIRIWGGGIYEDDALFNACDELGILVWQDFGFACASYPTYPSFLESVEEEARQNIRRLRNHPSLVIWAGNNEDYQVQERYKLEYNYEDKDPQSWLKSTFPARYTYEYLLPKIVKEEDPSAIYHPSSPWGDGKHTADPTVGDKHQWDLWHGGMNRYQEAPILSARFISEFGMEAYPHLETIQNMILDPEQRHPGSMMMDFRNKAFDHERRMITYIAENFKIKYDLASFTHLTQIVQSDTMKYAYESWRRDWHARRCGGVLVWQLNDCWPTTSWAIVDYHLVKKPAFYAISKALQPVAVGISRPYHSWTAGHADPTAPFRDNKFDLWIANSRLEELEVDVTVRFISIGTGKDVVGSRHIKVNVQANDITEVYNKHDGPPLDPQIDQKKPFDPRKYDAYVIHATVSSNGDTISSNTCWPQPIKYLDFGSRIVRFKMVSDTQIAMTSDRPIKGLVFEEKKGMKLSHNGFDLVPGEQPVVDVMGISLDSLRYTFVGAPEGSIRVSLS